MIMISLAGKSKKKVLKSHTDRYREYVGGEMGKLFLFFGLSFF